MVKDNSVMGEGIFLGEAFLPLQQIRTDDINRQLKVTYKEHDGHRMFEK